MILNERDARHEHILQAARQIMTAARTAPKGKGIDIIEVALITDEEIKQLSDTMIKMVEEILSTGCRQHTKCRMRYINRNARASTGTELRSLRILNLCRTYRRCSMCPE